ncbi:MAG: hypothetical protein ACJA1L_002327 [Paracoccaceae bacterium]|jgi:hypothetical protein
MSCCGRGPYCGAEPERSGPPSRARAILSRWAETAAAGAITAAALAYGVDAVSVGAWGGWALLALAIPLALWLRLAAIRAISMRNGLGAGVAMVDERRVTYMGPETGGALSLDTLRAVDIESGDAPTWILREEGGPTLRIPAGADGADLLPEALAALPGFSEPKALRALAASGRAIHPIWRRPAPAAKAISTF